MNAPRSKHSLSSMAMHNPWKPVINEFSCRLQPPDVFEKLNLPAEEHAVLLDSCGLGDYSYIAWDPLLIFKSKGTIITTTYHNKTLVFSGNPWDELQKILTAFKKTVSFQHPLEGGGCFGYLGYDLARFLEKIPSYAIDDLKVDDCYLMVPQKILIFFHKTHTIKMVYLKENEPDRVVKETINALKQQILSQHTQNKQRTSPQKIETISTLQPTFTQEAYLHAIHKAKEHIRNGNTYQIKLSQRLSFPCSEHPWNIYKRLRTINPSPYSAYVHFPSVTLVSCSPERLLYVDHGVATTRPIGGTYPKEISSQKNAALLKKFKHDAKECAEHTMLIDLERNDLGKVCELGSVAVKELMTIERYSHLYHIVTEICGRLRKEVSALDALKALFPGGTVTGCPKVRTMQILEELEPTRRGPYTGSIGFFSFNNCADFNIIIRTLIIKGTTGYVQVGGGIVADSHPETEYQETLWKAYALLEAAGVKNKYSRQTNVL